MEQDVAIILLETFVRTTACSSAKKLGRSALILDIKVGRLCGSAANSLLVTFTSPYNYIQDVGSFLQPQK